MDQYLKQIKAFTDREIIFSIHILKGVFSNVEYKLSADYLVSLIEANGLNGHQIKYLVDTTSLLLIDNKFIFENKNVRFHIFLYHEFRSFRYIYQFYNFPFTNDFYQKLLYSFDVCDQINCYYNNNQQYQYYNPHAQYQNPQAQSPFLNQSLQSDQQWNSIQNTQIWQAQFWPPMPPNQNLNAIQNTQFPHTSSPNQDPQVHQFQLGYHDQSGQPSSNNQNLTGSQTHHDHDKVKATCDYLRQFTNNFSKNSFFQEVEIKYHASFRLQIKQLNWVDSSNLDQLYWIIEYMQKNGLRVLPDIAVPHDAEYLYSLIVGSVQYHFANNSYNYQGQALQHVLDKMYNAWYQKTYRDKKDSMSALKYLISKRHLKSLHLLADERKATPIEVLEELIDNELRKK